MFVYVCVRVCVRARKGECYTPFGSYQEVLKVNSGESVKEIKRRVLQNTI